MQQLSGTAVRHACCQAEGNGTLSKHPPRLRSLRHTPQQQQQQWLQLSASHRRQQPQVGAGPPSSGHSRHASVEPPAACGSRQCADAEPAPGQRSALLSRSRSTPNAWLKRMSRMQTGWGSSPSVSYLAAVEGACRAHRIYSEAAAEAPVWMNQPPVAPSHTTPASYAAAVESACRSCRSCRENTHGVCGTRPSAGHPRRRVTTTGIHSRSCSACHDVHRLSMTHRRLQTQPQTQQMQLHIQPQPQLQQRLLWRQPQTTATAAGQQ
jgi:hypothetical protein